MFLLLLSLGGVVLSPWSVVLSPWLGSGNACLNGGIVPWNKESKEHSSSGGRPWPSISLVPTLRSHRLPTVIKAEQGSKECKELRVSVAALFEGASCLSIQITDGRGRPCYGCSRKPGSGGCDFHVQYNLGNLSDSDSMQVGVRRSLSRIRFF